jgi:hypothetical protein
MQPVQNKKVFDDPSQLNCHGCGVGLQSDNIASLGYVSDLKIKQYV